MRLSSFAGPSAEFDELVRRFIGAEDNRPTGVFRVPTDVFHTEGALVIRMDLPDVSPEDIDVSVQDNVLLINGTRRFPYDAERVQFVRRGTFYGDFTQRVALGKGLDIEKIQARSDAGVLELTIPHAEEVKPRKIEISTGSGSALREG